MENEKDKNKEEKQNIANQTEDTAVEESSAENEDFSDEISKILQEVRESTGSAKTEESSEDDVVDISAGVVKKVNKTEAADTKANAEPQSEKTQEEKDSEAAAEEPKAAKTVYKPAKDTAQNSTASTGKGKFVVMGLIGAVILLAGSFYGTMKLNPAVIPVSASVEVPQGTVPPASSDPVFVKGVCVAGVDVGGKTLSEAQALLAIKGTDLIPATDIKITYNDKEYNYSKSDFEYTYDIQGTLQKAYDFNTQLEQKNTTDAVSNAPTDDSTVAVDADKQTVNFNLDCQVTEVSVQKVVKRVAKEIDIAVTEPQVTKFNPAESDESKRYTFTDGKDGLAIDQDQLRMSMLDVFDKGESSADLSVVTNATKPTLKIEDVKKSIVKIGEFSTTSTNGYNANSNMDTAMNAINGTIINPGKTFSFNECTGDSNDPENGYVSAGVISGGQMQTGVGGGICQAATTIYNAGIMANMEIVERSPHLWCSYYVYGGLDATIDNPTLDLKMKNNSKYQMFMVTWMDGVTLNCEIYGWQSPDFDEIRTESTLEWTSGEEYGYSAQRVYYKSGKEVKREDLPSSSYSTSEGHSIRPEDPGDVSTKIKDQTSGYIEYAKDNG